MELLMQININYLPNECLKIWENRGIHINELKNKILQIFCCSGHCSQIGVPKVEGDCQIQRFVDLKEEVCVIDMHYTTILYTIIYIDM